MNRRLSLVALSLLVGFRSALAQDESAPIQPDLPPVVEDTGTPEIAEDPSITRVDILVVYTPAARANAGSTAAMRAAIRAYVATANRSYVNSDISVRLKLVGTAEVSYTENTSSMSNDLSWLAGNATVAALRNTYGADVVTLARRGGAGGAAGVGYLGSGNSSFAGYAFNVVADDWADTNLTFPHEVGHNFGCHHDHNNASGAAQVYAYGHRFNGTDNVQYRTIMAYAPGTRVAYFSNPTINYQGTATGVSGTGGTAADNAQMMETTAGVTAAYRSAANLAGSGVRGDFDGDGGVDLILQNTTTGAREFWIMSGIYRSNVVTLPVGSTAWKIATAGDFNGDGKSDLVFQNTSTGDRCIWLMDGTTRSSIVNLPTGNVAWRIAAAGDFNADGKTDLVYQNTSTGDRCIWLMDGVNRLSVVNLPVGALAWQIVACGDFNQDGSPDLVYQNTSTADRCIWLMNGVNRLSVVTLPAGAAAWQVVGAGDIDYDGKADLILEHTTNGNRAAWIMDGTTRSGVASFPNAATAWQISNR